MEEQREPIGLTRCLPFSEGQVRSPRARAQTFGGSAYDNGYRRPTALSKYVLTRLLANGTDAHPHQDISVERCAKVRLQCQQVWFYTRECFRKSGGCRERQTSRRVCMLGSKARTVGGKGCQSTPDEMIQLRKLEIQVAELSLTCQLSLVGHHSGSFYPGGQAHATWTHRVDDIRKRTVDQLGDLVP